MQRSLLILVFFLVGFPAMCQPMVDSLRRNMIAAKLKDPAREAYWTCNLAYHFSEVKMYDSALFYYYKVISNKNAGQPIIASALNGLGSIYSYRDYLDSSIFYYKQSIGIYEAIGDTANYATYSANLAIIYKNQGLYQDALDLAFETIRSLEKAPPSRELGSCLTTAALVYNDIQEFEQALVFHKKALAVRVALGLQRYVAQSLNNIGEIFIALHLYDSALHYLNESIKVKKDLGDVKSLPPTLNNLGLAFLNTGNFTEARKNLELALELNEGEEDRSTAAGSYILLAQLYQKDNRYDLARSNLARASLLSKNIGSLDLQSRVLALKIADAKHAGEYAATIRYFEDLLAIKDSLFGEEKIRGIVASEVQYETNKKQEEIILLNAKNEKAQASLLSQRRWIFSLVIGLALLSVIAMLVYRLFYVTRRGKRYAEMLLQELHHRMKNNLQILSSVLSLHSQELKDEKAIEAVKESEGRVHAMALIHKKLYNTGEHRNININEYLTELVSFLKHSYGFSNRPLSIRLELQDVEIDVDKAIPLGLVLNELLSNAFKHAFVDHESPELFVKLTLDPAKLLEINLVDNGISGEGVKLEKPESFGMKMVNVLLSDLRGTMCVSNGNGTTIDLKIPTI